LPLDRLGNQRFCSRDSIIFTLKKLHWLSEWHWRWQFSGLRMKISSADWNICDFLHHRVFNSDSFHAWKSFYFRIPTLLYHLDTLSMLYLIFEHLVLCFKGLNLFFEIFYCLYSKLNEWFITYKYELMRVPWCNLYESSFS
jgi:hypothetical protein